VADSCVHSNEPSGSVKGGEFLNQLSDCYKRTLLHRIGYVDVFVKPLATLLNW
jgi:hypothetical protein